jgi:hypothetical protein
MANNTIDRQSLSTDLVGKYNSSKVGGAYDAKKAGTSTAGASIQAANYDKDPNFVVKQSTTNFKGAESNNYNEISLYSKNVDLRKYKG